MSEFGQQIIFKQLFDHHERVRVPMIQRDYVQGRESESEVREDFLNALHRALQPSGRRLCATAELGLHLRKCGRRGENGLYATGRPAAPDDVVPAPLVSRLARRLLGGVPGVALPARKFTILVHCAGKQHRIL